MKQRSKPRLYGLTADGIRYPLFYGIFCDYCGLDITAQKEYEKDFFRCDACKENDFAAAGELRKLPLEESWEARRKVSRVILYLEKPALYANVRIIEIGEVLKRSAMIRHVRQQLDAGARNIQMGEW